MKLAVDDMKLFPIDYGELLRPDFRIVESRGWGQCSNETDELLVVYGPKHPRERSIFDNSPYVLPPHSTTPDRWDCDGFFVPVDLAIRSRWRAISGPLAVKFWDYRRFSVRWHAAGGYASSWHNGIRLPSQINWAIPNLRQEEIRARAKGLTSRHSGGM